MFELNRFLDKIKNLIPTEDIVSLMEKLPKDDPYLKEIAEGAGTVGTVIKIVLHVSEKLYEAKVPVEKRLSIILMRIMMESAKDSIPYSFSDMKIEEMVKTKKNDDESEDFENIVLELFDSKHVAGNSDYLPDHPVFIRFKSLLRNGIEEFNNVHQSHINIPLFLSEFNSNVIVQLEKEHSGNEELKNLLHKWKINSDFKNLLEYLKNAKELYLEKKSLDKKSVSEYYVENKIYKVPKETWGYKEDKIKEKEPWTIKSFLDGDEYVEVIAAPFGIGKSSLAKRIAYEYATKFIENPDKPKAFVPIFVPLKYSLESTCNGKSLENDLYDIASISTKEKDTNMLVLLDGLDELPDDRPVNLHNIYDKIQGFIKQFPKAKFIVTTRLEAGYPSRLNIEKSYVRLFSFDKENIKDFFQSYGMRDDYAKVSDLLTEKRLGKPLFCWMIATVYNKLDQEEREVLFDLTDSHRHSLGELFLYQRFIHDVILGKPRDTAEREYEKWFEKSRDEKKALRLIAFLKNNDTSISKPEVVATLKNFEFVLPSSAESIVSTYFSSSKDEQGMEKIEFTHKSFQEYLLAEFYLESIINGRYYRLIGNEPTVETHGHLSNLISFLTNNNQKIIKYAEDFARSLYEEDIKVKLKDIIKTLRSNSLEYSKQPELITEIPRRDSKVWSFSPLKYNDLSKICSSRMISINVAGKLFKDKDMEEDYIRSVSFFILNSRFLVNKRIFVNLNLKYLELTNADLTDADFSNTNLTDAKLSGAYLPGAILTNANLTGAILTGAILTNANLTGAILTVANLTGAILTVANLTNANLTNANLPGAILTNANLTNANLTNANLTNANLTNANLTNANLTDAILANADLTNANLTGAILANADLTNANLTGAILTNAILTNAKLTDEDLTDNPPF